MSLEAGEPTYDIIEKTELLRMVLITLQENQEVPWHWHNECPDTFFAMEGQVNIETKADEASPPFSTILSPGQMLKVNPGIRHRVSGFEGKHFRVAVLQGVGKYDLQIA